jgi:antagonist of KipI
MACLQIIKPGLLTTIQDRGRWGFQSSGVPVAGPMDPRAHRLANALVGNESDAATLEVTLLGPEIEFEDARTVAVAGAEFALTVDGRVEQMHRPLAVRPGSRLRLGHRSRGARAYVAIGGGLAVPPAFGSRATHLVSRMGGFEGRALAAGDRIRLGDVTTAIRAKLDPTGEIFKMPDRPARLRVLPGPQHDRFVENALDTLQSAPYTIAKDSDRMGFRLQGPALRHRSGADIISDATPLGVLQVPASEQPVLLMADRQTTGGYAKIATVITADIGLAGQLAPGDTIAFAVCSRADAIAALIAQERALMAIEGSTGRDRI